MEVKIEGNPGTGNTFQEININGPIENYLPNATQVVNNYYGTTKKAQDAEPVVDRATLKKKILEDVGKLVNMVYKRRQTNWMDLWNDLLDLPEVKYEVCNPGNNHDTIYNRKLVAGIIHFIASGDRGCLGWFSKYNASEITRILGYKEGASIRGELGGDPSVEVREAINKLITEKYE